MKRRKGDPPKLYVKNQNAGIIHFVELLFHNVSKVVVESKIKL